MYTDPPTPLGSLACESLFEILDLLPSPFPLPTGLGFRKPRAGGGARGGSPKTAVF